VQSTWKLVPLPIERFPWEERGARGCHKGVRGRGTDLGELDITLGLQSGGSGLVFRSQAIISPVLFTSRAPQAELKLTFYNVHTLANQHHISIMRNTYKGQRIYSISNIQNKGNDITYSTKARSSPRTDDLKVSSVKSSTSEANVVAKNGRIASRAPDSFIFMYMDMSKVYRRDGIC
jgi:hypothetical protein